METLITVNDALKLIKCNVSALDAVLMDIKEAIGLTIAEDIISNLDIPAFPQSNMDGYAFAFNEERNQYSVVGEVAAGSNQNFILEKDTAVRIFTGAAVPTGADTVLMQEKAKLESGVLIVLDENLKKGDNVRAIGTEMKKGKCAIEKGTILKPATIGFLAGIGIDKVLVYPRPKVSIIVTGNELQKPGIPLEYGQVYESNSYTLSAALNEQHINNISIVQAPDQLDQLTSALNNALSASDIVLMTGGVSVGDYDFTLSAFEHAGVTPIFHKIKQKPGKPLLFGMQGNKIVFGLPGNPASVLTCFYEYVLPAIGLLSNIENAFKVLQVPISHDFKKPIGLTHFLKGFYNGLDVVIQTGQESYKLSSYASANCLVVLPEECGQVKGGEMVNIHLLP